LVSLPGHRPPVRQQPARWPALTWRAPPRGGPPGAWVRARSWLSVHVNRSPASENPPLSNQWFAHTPLYSLTFKPWITGISSNGRSTLDPKQPRGVPWFRMISLIKRLPMMARSYLHWGNIGRHGFGLGSLPARRRERRSREACGNPPSVPHDAPGSAN